ncbi:MAG: ThuA domain-containing protein [Candidatus Brocadiia bacterium]
MSPIETLLVAGGEIHDWKSCGAEIRKTLDADGQFNITYVKNDLSVFETDLDQYDVLVFYYTVGEITTAQKNGLLEWVANGNGYVGIHSAADSFRGCPEYRAMVGGHFVTHPRYREYQVMVTDPEHPITEGLLEEEPPEFTVTDEMYVTSYDERNHILAQALWEDRTVPVAWVKDWAAGRVYWLALGHDGKACQHEMFKKLLVRGTVWAATSPEEDE